MRLKIGQTVWMKEDRSDFECKVVGKKIVERLIDGEVCKYYDYLIARTRLNSYHESFATPESRTYEDSYRFYPDENRIVKWRSFFMSDGGEWETYEYKIFKKKPRKLRRGP